MNRVEVERLADRLLAVIRTRLGARFGVEHLSEELGVGRELLGQAAEKLESWGYTLQVTETEMRLLGTPDSLTATELGWGLDTRFIGRRLLAFNEVKSTNDIAAREAEGGAVEGTTVVAEHQVAGRGRLGRVWHSPSGMGAYISIVLRPKFLPEKAPGLSLMTAMALAEAIETTGITEVKIKWPNDIMLSGRKVAGILTELAADHHKIHYVVVGVGINVNQQESDFTDEIRGVATSVRMAAGREISRVGLVQSFFREFEREYLMYSQEFLAGSIGRLRRYSSLLGQAVRLDTGQGVIEGRAVDIDVNGALVLERDGGRLVVSAGDVTVVKG